MALLKRRDNNPMNLEGMSKKELIELVIELAASLKEEDLHDPETYSMVGQILDLLDDSGNTLPQELIDQLSSLKDPKEMFMQAIQLLGISDPNQLDGVARSLKASGLLKSEDAEQLLKAAPIDVTNSHILFFPAKIKGKTKDAETHGYHVTLKWMGVDKPVEHDEVQKLVDKHMLHPPKPKKLVPVTWKSPRGDLHVLALQGDHDNLHGAHEDLSKENKSIHPYVPHITVSKEIHDSIPAEGVTPEELGLEFGPLQYHIGHQHIKDFHPAPRAEEHFTKPVELYENHPIHKEIQDHTHYKTARRIADLNNDDIKKSDSSNKAMQMALAYAQSKGLKLNHDLPVHKVNVERAKKIADAYHNMPHNPDHPEVKASYDALINETLEQFKFLKSNGLKFSQIEKGMDNPYKSGSSALRQDLNDNHHLWYFPTDQGFGSGEETSNHPMLRETDEHHNGKKLLANDVFRIVHDYFGHSKEGHTFGPHGEDNAWKTHMQMYSPLARKALTTETRGQNSWVNYGPHGDKNRKDPVNTTYADQKAGLLPDWAMEHEHFLTEAPQAQEHYVKPNQNNTPATPTPASPAQKPTKLAASELARKAKVTIARNTLRKIRG
jgi:hypothetical protein